MAPRSEGRRDKVSTAKAAVLTPAYPEHLPALTSVRFFLALGVVIFHYQVNMLPEDASGFSLIERSRLAVDFFFILSGFVLAHVYGKQVRSGSYSHRRFLIARFARIYPAHIAMLAFMGGLAILAMMLGQSFQADLYTVSGWLSAAALIHSWFPAGLPNEWNGPSWSLSAEWGAYLLFPAFGWMALRARRSPWATISVAAVLFLALDSFYRTQFSAQLTHAENNLGILRILPEFLYGIGLYQLGSGLSPKRGTAIAAAGLAVTTLLTLMSVAGDERLIVLVAGLVILALANLSRTEADQPFRHPWLLEAGEASYALYLVHLPMLVVWKNGMGMLTGQDSGYLLSLWEVGPLLILTLIAAFLMHGLWERPVRRWVRSRFLTPPAFSPSNPKGNL